MTNGPINQYDTVELLEDVNSKIKRGMKGVVLEKYNDDNYEIEFLDKDGINIYHEMEFTFTINGRQIRKIE